MVKLMQKVILLNGAITLLGLLLDIYGIFDLSLLPAVLGLTLGLVDCLTFIWMREEIKAMFVQWRKNWNGMRGYVIKKSWEELEQGKPEVSLTVLGRRMLNRVLIKAKKLGYEVADLSESGATFTVTLKKKRLVKK